MKRRSTFILDSISSILIRRSASGIDSRSTSSRTSSSRPAKTVRFHIGQSPNPGPLHFGVGNKLQTKNNSSQNLSKPATSIKPAGSSILNNLSTLESQIKSVMPTFNISLGSENLRVRSKPYSVGNFGASINPKTPTNVIRAKVPLIVSQSENPSELKVSETDPVWKEKTNLGALSKDFKLDSLPLGRSNSEYRIKALHSAAAGVYNQTSDPPSLEYLPFHPKTHVESPLDTKSQEIPLEEKHLSTNPMRLSQNGWLNRLPKKGQQPKYMSVPDYSAIKEPVQSTIFYDPTQMVSPQNFEQPFRDASLLKRYRVSRAQQPPADAVSGQPHIRPAFFAGHSQGLSAPRSEKDVWFARQKLLSQSSRDRPRQLPNEVLRL